MRAEPPGVSGVPGWQACTGVAMVVKRGTRLYSIIGRMEQGLHVSDRNTAECLSTGGAVRAVHNVYKPC